jgi:predicted nuclease of predicted toxin-antitoxin system
MPPYLIDENLPYDLVELANENEADATWIREIAPGAADSLILTRVRSSGEILATRDVRFANRVFAGMTMGEAIAGVVLIREEKMQQIRQAWSRFLKSESSPKQSLVVLEAHRMRIRQPPTDTE